MDKKIYKNNKADLSTSDKVGIGALLFLGCVVISVIVLFTGFDMVSAGHVGVKDRFGNVLGTMDPGMQWTGLFVGVEEYPLGVQSLNLDQIESVDKDGQAVYVWVAVNYRIRGDKAESLYKDHRIRSNEVINRFNVLQKVTEGVKQVTVQYEALETLQHRDEVRKKIIQRIEELFPNEYLELSSITITNIDFAPSFNAAIQLKKDNEQLAFAAENKVKEEEAKAKQKIEQARGAAESKKLNADAVAYELRAQRQEITPMLLQKMYYDTWNGVLPTMLLGGSDNGLIFQIPDQTQSQYKVTE